MYAAQKALQALEEGQGILRLAPTWVPRSFCRPGKRIKLHPSDYYALGLERGGIDERWFASTTKAENGPLTAEDEGLSYVVFSSEGADRILLRDAVEALKGDLIGDALWQTYGGWPMYSKFFDNEGPLPHHVHHREEHAQRVGQHGKPEMYFFPAQLNNHGGEFPFTFFGLNPEVTREELKASLQAFAEGDNRLLDLSRAYRLTLDTGWDVPPGILHAPGSLCTYEPQFASDVFAMYQSVLYGGHCVPESLLWKDTPSDHQDDFDYLIEVLDWELNVDPDFHAERFMAPKLVHDAAAMQAEGYTAEWICYRCRAVSAQRLTIQPGRSVRIRDAAAYGFIAVQGRGTCGPWSVETPSLIRYGELTQDEFFVSQAAAQDGVAYSNTSLTEPLVLLKHFAENPDLPPGL